MAGAALMLATPDANAQFGLGKLKKKVENKVKDKVKKKVDQTVDKATDKALNAAEDKVDNTVNKAVNKAVDKGAEAVGVSKEDQSSMGGSLSWSEQQDALYQVPDYNKTYKPSAEAKAADPKAEDKTVEPGFTKSIGAIHAAYEHIGEKNTFYSPYYKVGNNSFYYTHKEGDKNVENIFWNMFKKSIAADPNNIYWVTDYVTIDTDNPGVVVPADELFINSWMCLFMADPKSSKALDLYMKADAYANAGLMSSQRQLGLNDMTNGVVDDEHILPANFTATKRQREFAAEGLLFDCYSYADLVKYAQGCAAKVKNGTDVNDRMLNFLILDRLVDHFLPNYSECRNDNSFRLLENVRNSNRNLYDLSVAENGEAVAEPKGVKVSAEIQSMGTKAAKEYVTGTLEKVIYLESQWHPYKSPKWPYEIVGYGLSCAVISTENGQRYIQYTTLTKSPNGGNCFMQAGTDAQKRRVK